MTIQLTLPKNEQVINRTMLMKRHQRIASLFSDEFWVTRCESLSICSIVSNWDVRHLCPGSARYRAKMAYIPGGDGAHLFCAACRCGAVGGWKLLICWVSIKRKILITTPVQVVDVIRILWRFLADSNRRARFCRPLTKPLIQGTLSFSFAMQRYTFFLICKNTQMKISSFVAFIFAFFGLVP